MGYQDHSESAESSEEEIAFFPNHLLSEIALSLAILGFILIFASLFPTRLAEKYDPLNPPQFLEPEWYFMGVYQVLKTQGVQPIHGVILLAVLGLLVILVPFVDRGTRRSPRERPLMMAAALVIILQFFALTAYGYATPGQTATFTDPSYLAMFVLVNVISLSALLIGARRQRRISRGANIA